jgi:Flp pilus assembly protein TadD
VYANQGKPDRAERSYEAAIAKDSSFLPARFNLANLYNLTGRNRDAEKVLREGMRHAPEQGELYYSLGLLLVEEQRLEEAVQALARAAELIPDRARIHYNFGLALQHLDRRAEAEKALLEAHRLEPADPDTLYALVILYMQQSDWNRAEPFAEDLVRLFPDAPGPLQMLRDIRSREP